MKKIVFVIPLIASLQLFAQPSIGITTGLNLPWQYFKGDYGKYRFDIFPSFNVGLVGEVSISKKLILQPSLIMSGKGGQGSSLYNNSTFSRKIRLYYMELPLIFNYAITVNSAKILIGAGSSFAWGFSGSDRQYMNNNFSFEYDAFESYFKKFDAGIICQAAYRKKALMVSAFYNFGVANIFNNDNPNLVPGSEHIIWKNNVVGISLAYLFKLKK